MPGERVQRQIDALLDDVEVAARALDWGRVRDLCDGVLRLDPDNEDARTFLSAAERDTGVLAADVEQNSDLSLTRDEDGSRPPALPTGEGREPTLREPQGGFSKGEAATTPASFANGRYQVSRFLGEGGKKRVYLAHDTLLDREVAFALIKTEGFDLTSKERISREAQAMGRLGVHPNIVAVLDLGQEDDGSPYMVTELMGGGDVEGLLEAASGRATRPQAPALSGRGLQESPLPLGEGGGEGNRIGLRSDPESSAPDNDTVGAYGNTPRALRLSKGGASPAPTTRVGLPLARTIEIGKAVCEGLEFAHTRGIVHRDLKPGNVWLTEDGTAKIGDFGLAVMTDRSRLTREGMMVGTVSYMPPEQATGGEITPKADLYSLGAMLYEMVTGRPPFLGDDEIAIIGQHINTPPVAPTWHNGDCPRPLEALIMRLLSKAPSERPESAQDVYNALDAIDLTARGETVERESNSLDSLAGGVFVGRQQEMDQLKAALEDVLGGRGRLVTLAGEPGIGKTRISEELATYAGLRGAKVLWGRCYETGGQPPYWPWVQAIRSYVRETDPDELRRQMGSSASVVAEIVTDVKDRLPELQSPPQLDDPDSARFRLFDSITSFLKTASQARPLVIVLDDLHWSDGPSLTFLEFVAREIGQSRVLVIGTYRDMELNRRHPLTVTLGDLSRERLFERVLLRGLTQRDIARFIEIAAGIQPPAELSATVHRHTEGNPLFVTEVVRELVQSGELAENRASGDSTWSVRIPEGVREVIGRRLDRLSERTNEVLTTAAVVGRDFTLDALRALYGGAGETAEFAPSAGDPRAVPTSGGLATPISDSQLLDVLDEALDARIIEELSGEVGHYQFTHALMQETLTGELSLTRRVRLHARIAETLEQSYGQEAGGHATELAHHFGEAQAILGVERFLGYALLAGDAAIASHAYEEAEFIYHRAVGLIDGGPTTPVQAQLFAGLGRVYAAQARIEQALSNLRLGFEYHAAAGDIDAAVAVAETPIPPYAGLTSGAIDLCARALELVPVGSHQSGRLLARHGQLVSMQDSDDVRGSESFDTALEIARQNQDAGLEAKILAHRAFAKIYQHGLDPTAIEQLDSALVAVERARQVGDLLSEVEATYAAFMIAVLNGKLDVATDISADCLGSRPSRWCFNHRVIRPDLSSTYA
ncbi:MAG: protein kinase, partial [Chloroflexi bacterium]|nr:protein kinase [Chloroflexota bacterium]